MRISLAKKSKENVPFNDVLKSFEKAFKKLFDKGSYKPSDLLKIPEYKEVIEATSQVFSSAIPHEVPTEMKAYLEKDAFVFSGLKTHAQLTEARSLLKDEKGNIRPYYQFEREVLKLNEKYNKNYLEAEYQFAVSSSQSAANWANLQEDTERYWLEYRTAGDEKVRQSHANLNGICLPKNDPFWQEFYPPNGWRCRCIAVEVLAKEKTPSNSNKAILEGQKATTQISKTGKNKLAMFRFNAGLQGKLFPPDNSYTKVVGATEVKKELEKEVKETQYKNASMKQLEAMYESQKINLENEKIIMNDGYVATANSFFINEKLRLDKPLSDNDKKVVNALDSLIKENKLHDNFLLYRNDGIGFIEAHFGLDVSKMNNQEIVKALKLTGKTEFSDKGFYSVSAIKEENAFRGRKIHTEIRTKKGTNAFITYNYDESEIILGRNQKFRILDILEENNKVKIITETAD